MAEDGPFPAKTLDEWAQLARTELRRQDRSTASIGQRRRASWSSRSTPPPISRGSSSRRRSHCRASRLICAGRGPPCTPTGPGPSANMPASRPPRSPTPSTARISRPARWACRSPSISPPIAATTATIRASSAMSARPASRSTRVEDMKILFDGIPLDKMSVSMTMNGAVLPVLAGYIVAGRGAGRAAGQAVGHDPERHPQGVHGPQHLHLSARTLDAHRRRHHRIHRAAHAEVQLDLDLRLSHAGGRRDARCRSSPSRWPTGSNMCAPPWRKGSTIDEFAPRLSFFFGIGMNFFMEVAKLRAARLLWARADAAVRAARTRRAWRCARIARPRA